jgi:FAD/FMN-containing dehydrogenase
MTATTTLEDLLGCPVFHPGRPGYAEEVTGFNLATVHTPDVVVGATCTADVVAAVRWAAERSIAIAVQATGHGATSPVDGGLLISTRRMNDVAVDPRTRTATVGAGATWRTVLAAAAPHGLAGLSGSSTGVGVVGYTLGGGLPVLGRTFGWAAERVRRLEVVTADGELHRVDAQTEPELFRALRGGKGNVGIVTSMTFELLPVTRIHGGGLVFPGERAADVLAAYAAWAPRLPDTVSTAVQLLRLPPFPDVPEPLRGRFVVRLSAAATGDAGEAARLLAPMRAVTPPILDAVGELPVTRIDDVYQDPDHPVPAEEGSQLLADLPDAAVRTLLDLAGPGADPPLLLVALRHLGGALARPATADGDAICARDARFLLQTVGVPAGPRAAEVTGAVAAVLTAMAPHSTGRTLLNLHGRPGDDADRARPWTPEVHDRLRRAKGRYDPANLLRSGHAVAPLPAA